MNKRYAASIIILAGLLVGGQALSQIIKFKPLSQLPEEQQAILAVNQASLSVVTIVGRGKKIVPESGSFALVPQEPITIAEGTGFVWSPDGIIVSNSHVVSDESLDYFVKFTDGRNFPAKVIGTDKVADIAALKIEAQGLTAAKLGDSDKLEAGQSVFAIGNSLGRYQNTVTRGIVSGLGRAVSVGNISSPRLQDLIQTDAAINPGNSGGPLINLAGEVVGMNTVIDIEGSSLGFAIPVNMMKKSVQQLRDLGKVSRPMVGIGFKTVDDLVRIEEDYQRDLNGAIVMSVVENGPAAKAGIKTGDIIIEIDKKSLNENNELDTAIRRYEAGNQILVTILRKDERLDLPLILEEYK